MMLRRIARSFCAAARLATAASLVVVLSGACDKPKEKECRKAIDNIRKIYGTDDNSFGVSPEAMVRSCQGSASPESVQCFIQAASIEELQKCEGGAFAEMFGSQEDGKADKKDEDGNEEKGKDEGANAEGANAEGANAEGANAGAQGGQTPAE